MRNVGLNYLFDDCGGWKLTLEKYKKLRQEKIEAEYKAKTKAVNTQANSLWFYEDND
ncbi:hypothetical protein [Geminocystis sp.]|uniref:hypothetical protein n=1 Tax=Geminocystis sp. TaxID=2664100 RepID=UPI003593E224